jgi:DnaK suppressor protein
MAALTESQLDQLVEKLKVNYQELLGEVRDELEHTGDQQRIELLNREPGDSGDESAATALADLNLTMVDRQVQELHDIEAALLRVKEGEYGVCIDCGVDIAFERLQAYPTAKRCILCQEKREKLYSHGGHPKM